MQSNESCLINNEGNVQQTAHIVTTEQPIMTLYGKGAQILRFEANGDIFIHGKLVTNDLDVVKGFKEFLICQGFKNL